MLRSHPSTLERLYTLTAPRYEAAIAPLMRPLAADLVAAARREGALSPGATVLDLGTGSGVLAHLLAGQGLTVIGIDRVLPMLRLAQTVPPPDGPSRPHFVQADAERLGCLADRSCDVALASFGLADCDPERVLRALRRVLRPGGWFLLQEWGPLDGPDDPRAIVDDVLGDFAQPAVDAPLAALRAWLARPRPWDARLQDADDYADLLAEHGFTVRATSESRPVTLHLPDSAAFLDFALAWAPRRLELDALPPAARGACRAAMAARLAALTASDGSLSWRPALFRASAVVTSL